MRKKKLALLAKLFCLSLLIFWNSLNSALLFGEEDKNDAVKRKRKLIFLPIIFYTPETKLAGGVGGIYYFPSSKNRATSRPSSIFMDFYYTQKKQILVECAPDLYLNNEHYHLKAYFSFRKYIDKFYGIGSSTTKNMEENYTSRTAKINIRFLKKVAARLYIGFQYELEHTRIIEVEEDGLLAEKEIVGKEGGTVSGLGPLINWDSRDQIFFPRRGSLFQLSAGVYKNVLGSNYKFNKFTIDIRQYIPFLSSHVVAFQGYLNLIKGDAPFQKLSILGGPNIMRGYYLGRYRDKNMIVFQVEYRTPVWWRLGVVVFAGYGDVTDQLKNFRWRNIKYSYGGGIRYQINRVTGTNLRFDFGWGKESFGVYVTVNEAF